MLIFFNYVDNIHVENYGESMLNIYFPFTKPSSPYNCNALVFLVVHAWNLLLHSHMTVMAKYSNAKICIFN